MRKNQGALILVAVLLGVSLACSDSGETTSQDASSSTATTIEEATTTSEAPTTVDPTEADAKLIVDFNRAWSDSSLEGLRQFFDFGAAHAYPPGQFTADMITCMEARRLSPPGSPWTNDRFIELGEQLDMRYENIVDRATVEPAPDWTVPNHGGPGSGTRPEGRVYVFSIATSTSLSAQPSVYETHATVLDGEVYWFPAVPEECLV